MNYPYQLTIESEAELDALEWAGARWEGAHVLYGHLHVPEDWDGATFPVVMGLAEHEAWAVRDAIEAEDAGVIPCLADALNGRIAAMLNSII